MEASTRLYDLIASMSKQEKRYFKLYSSFYAKKSSKKCEDLFDCINKAKIRSDESLQQKSAGSFALKSLPRLKSELTTMVLDSIVSFRAQHLMENDIRNTLLHVEVLLEKGLHQHAGLLIERAKKKARETESYPMQMQALFWERSLLLSRYDRNIEQQLDSLYDEIEQSIQEQQTFHRYARLQDSVTLLWGSDKQRADGDSAAKLESIIRDPLIRDAENASTLRSRVARLHILGVDALRSNDLAAATSIYEQIIAILDEHPALIKKYGVQYVRYLVQHLACLVEIKNERDAARVAARIKAFEQLPPHVKILSKLRALGLELTLYINLGQVKRALQIVEDIEGILREQRLAIHPQTYINLCHNCAVFYFLIGRHAESLEFVNHMLAEKRIVLRKDLQGCARALNLVLHFELGNLDSLEHLFRSTYRYLKQHDRLDSLEKTVLNWLRKLNYCYDRQEQLAVFRSFRAELEALQQEASSPISGLEEILYWTRSKAEGRPIRDVYLSSVSGKQA